MIFDKLFTQNTVLGTAMQASEFKNQVILHNMANSDTPNFKGSEFCYAVRTKATLWI